MRTRSSAYSEAKPGPAGLERLELRIERLGLTFRFTYGHTNPWRVGPYQHYHDLIVDRYTDPDETRGPASYGPRTGRMTRITVPEVLERVRSACERYGVGPC